MLDFSDAPYHFFEPNPSRGIITLARQVNRMIALPGSNHRVRKIEITGACDEAKAAVDRGDRLLFVINHPSHSDPQVITEVHRRLGINSCFMAAYDVFLRARFTAWTMQRLGNFSIDREGSDRKAMSTAIKILSEGPQMLNIFPEGNVYLTNDRVTPFLDGTAFIALKAQKSLGEKPVKIVPISLKFTQLEDIFGLLNQRLRDLSVESEFPDQPDPFTLADLVALGEHLIARRLKRTGGDRFEGIDPSSPSISLAPFAETLVQELESEFSLQAKADDKLIDRIRRVRSTVHQRRIAEEGTEDPALADAADRAILAFRLHGYTQPYLTEKPTLDRAAETVERISEDYQSKALAPLGPRQAHIHLHEPIDVRDSLEAASGKLRDAVAPLTLAMESTVQSGVDEINCHLDTPGAQLIV
ncbi:MAG: lysophospholipid acyltransferase family protein [Verrucomicrobiota bacterium]